MKQELIIWADNTEDAKKLILHLQKEYVVNHKLSASPEPVVNLNGNLIIGLGNIYKEFQHE